MYSELLSSYNLIIICSIILIISFFFGEFSKRTGVPSVLLLIVLGIALQFVLQYFEIYNLDFFPILEMLGIVGLIMIVLEAALELKLDKDKVKPIIYAFLIAIIGLFVTCILTAKVLMHFIPTLGTMQAWLYATPLSILSSAIIIPSVSNLRADKKEFHIYESTFSDIIGIMLFYFITAQLKSQSIAIEKHTDYSLSLGIIKYSIEILITILLSVFFSYIIVIVFQKLKSQVKLFLLIALLMLLYAIGKQMHLSSLLIILTFGLVIANTELFFNGKLKRFLDVNKVHSIYHSLHEITMETAFVVRTFFFVIFGITLVFASLANVNVVVVSLILLVIIFVVRFILLRIFIGKDIIPQIFIAPRGLITILLFYAIPKEYQAEDFDNGILLFIIIGTSIVMTFSMIYNKKRASKAINKANSVEVKTDAWNAPGLD